MFDNLVQELKPVLLPSVIDDECDKPQKPGQRQASVLMPLIMRGEWHVIFTKRPMSMPNHAGQISFPGGRAEACELAHECALRETNEEIGIKPENINLLGRLPSFNSVSDFRITPFIGLVDNNAKIIPCPNEVDEVFELPFSFFMDKKNHIKRIVEFEGKEITIYDMPYPCAHDIKYNIWGMTAMIIYGLYQRLYQ